MIHSARNPFSSTRGSAKLSREREYTPGAAQFPTRKTT